MLAPPTKEGAQRLSLSWLSLNLNWETIFLATTLLAWVFCGPTTDCGQECSVSMNVQVCTDEHLNDTLKNFCYLESIGIKPVETESSASHTEAMILQNF